MKSKLECPVCHKTIHVDKDEVANYRCEDCDVMFETTEAVPKVCGTCNGIGAVMIGDDFYEHPEPCPTCTKQEEPKAEVEFHYKLQTIIERIQRNAKSVERRDYCDADKMVAVEEIINFYLTREQSAVRKERERILIELYKFTQETSRIIRNKL